MELRSIADESAERTILGAVLVENAAWKEARELGMDDFSLDSHRRIFRAMSELEGQPIDTLTLRTQLRKRKEFEAVGGEPYIAELTNGIPRRLSIAQWVRILKEKTALRRIIGDCTAVIEQASSFSAEPESCAPKLEDALRAATQWQPEPATDKFFVGGLTFANSVPDDIDWAVKGIIPRGWNGFIIAEPKSLKSYSAVDLLISLSMGLPWLGFTVPKRMRTALLAREDYWTLTSWRIKQLVRGKMEDFPNFDKFAELDDWLYVNTRAQTSTFALDNAQDLRSLIANLKARRVEFLVMDVFRRLHFADENDNSEMQVILDRVTRIQGEVGCAIGIVHHTNKGEGPIFMRSRGASAIHGFMEWGIALSTVNPEDSPRERIRKMEFLTKAGQEPDPIYVRSVSAANWLKLELAEYDGGRAKLERRKTAAERLMQ